MHACWLSMADACQKQLWRSTGNTDSAVTAMHQAQGDSWTINMYQSVNFKEQTPGVKAQLASCELPRVLTTLVQACCRRLRWSTPSLLQRQPHPALPRAPWSSNRPGKLFLDCSTGVQLHTRKGGKKSSKPEKVLGKCTDGEQLPVRAQHLISVAAHGASKVKRTFQRPICCSSCTLSAELSEL